mmetsp:Transcript_8536/g.14395  ORF Transcript_8536/g.14395 Transcript_8536/m.14395 type:complete len:105 (-) Transcript_8536:1109-1423(-)|eukprot:CAMPEP_0168617096 /NCGR_PEP_ID=MMETSP0449_2-20121227/5369_1 /TAXON_ID=1082188 /ORGANISM="Strombidium rassoulzadegani, Strain ras09" /LENGTH=104 /DNA_ID=CAMNT_0008657907 /DNA_START=241 /DNA_END=555 /DNA_ORIENTATION=-
MNWMSQVKEHASTDVKKILLANKCDMEDEIVITREQGEEIAKSNGMEFFETSAKSGLGVNEAFESIARQIVLQLEEQKKKQAHLKQERQSENGGTTGEGGSAQN